MGLGFPGWVVLESRVNYPILAEVGFGITVSSRGDVEEIFQTLTLGENCFFLYFVAINKNAEKEWRKKG